MVGHFGLHYYRDWHQVVLRRGFAPMVGVSWFARRYLT